MNQRGNSVMTSRSIWMVVGAAALVSGLSASCKSNTIDNKQGAIDNSTNNNGEGGVTVNVIGARGGIVVGPEGASVRVPGGALMEDTEISISVAEPAQYPPLPAGYAIRSKVFAFEPHGLQFLSPAIVSLPFTPGQGGSGGMTGLRADPGGSWAPVASQIGGEAQIATPSFSFYVVAQPEGPAADSGPTCSGRGPDTSAPTGTFSGGSGHFIFDGTLDVSTLVDGYASVDAQKNVELVFQPFAKACGFARNGVHKSGALTMTLRILGPVTTSTYSGAAIHVAPWPRPADATLGACQLAGPMAQAGSPLYGPAPGPGVSIAAIDATHVAGTFDVTPYKFVPGQLEQQGERITGTFNLPICAPIAGLTPAACCVP
jgi:hypothetical protein